MWGLEESLDPGEEKYVGECMRLGEGAKTPRTASQGVRGTTRGFGGARVFWGACFVDWRRVTEGRKRWGIAEWDRVTKVSISFFFFFTRDGRRSEGNAAQARCTPPWRACTLAAGRGVARIDGPVSYSFTAVRRVCHGNLAAIPTRRQCSYTVCRPPTKHSCHVRVTS